jgi:soluble lytic murein transglycosylase-like protein
MDINERINRVKSIVRGDRFRFALIVAIPLVVIMGWIFANPFSPTAMPFQTTPRILQPSGQTIPVWLVNGADAGLADKIRNAKRVLLYEPTAFNRIARIHQILSAYHSGLSVEDVERLSELIYQESVRYGYDPELIVSVILTESSFYNGALSRKGAIGLMQIKPVTGQELAEYNRTPFRNAKALFDPHLNIKLGIQYLALLHQRFGDLGIALVAYNYGPTRVAQLMDHGKQLPPGYAQKILRRYKHLIDESPDPILAASANDAS